MSAVALVVVALATAMAYRQAERRVELAATTKVTATALSLAATDDVIEGLASSDPAAALRDFAERARQATGTDFVVVMSPTGVRYTHPNPDLVGASSSGRSPRRRPAASWWRTTRVPWDAPPGPWCR